MRCINHHTARSLRLEPYFFETFSIITILVLTKQVMFAKILINKSVDGDRSSVRDLKRAGVWCKSAAWRRANPSGAACRIQ